MSVIEDSRKVLQDFLAPQLRAIAARLDALEKKVDENERRAEKCFDDLTQRIKEYERRAERRFDDVMGAIRQVIDWSSVQQRLARLGSRESKPQ